MLCRISRPGLFSCTPAPPRSVSAPKRRVLSSALTAASRWSSRTGMRSRPRPLNLYDSHRLPAFFVPVDEARLVAVLVLLRRQLLSSPAPVLQPRPSSRIHSHVSHVSTRLTHKQYLALLALSHARFISKALTLQVQRLPWTASEALASHLCSAATLRRLLHPGPPSAHRDKRQRSV